MKTYTLELYLDQNNRKYCVRKSALKDWAFPGSDLVLIAGVIEIDLEVKTAPDSVRSVAKFLEEQTEKGSEVPGYLMGAAFEAGVRGEEHLSASFLASVLLNFSDGHDAGGYAELLAKVLGLPAFYAGLVWLLGRVHGIGSDYSPGGPEQATA